MSNCQKNIFSDLMEQAIHFDFLYYVLLMNTYDNAVQYFFRRSPHAFCQGPPTNYVNSFLFLLGPYFNPRSRQRIPRDLAMCVTPSGQFYCSMCNVGASEELEFRQHLETKQHKSKVSEQRYRSEMENLGYI